MRLLQQPERFSRSGFGWFSDTVKRIPLYVFQEIVDTF